LSLRSPCGTLGAVNAPRWFYVVIALAVAVASAAVTYRALRPADVWVQYHPGAGLEDGVTLWFLNTRTHVVCFRSTKGASCFDPLDNAKDSTTTH
jgi:hypothetical protein